MARDRGGAVATSNDKAETAATQRMRIPTNGPHDGDTADPEITPAPGTMDFGAVKVPVPAEGSVTVEPSTEGRIQAVHVSVPEGRLSVSALAAPRTGGLWPDLADEIHASLREGGARVRSFTGQWGRELHATTEGATSVFVGVDGPRWMLYGVATGPTRDAVALDARLRRMLRGTVVVRGRAPYPVRTVLPLATPSELGGELQQPSTAAPPTMTLRAPAAMPDAGEAPAATNGATNGKQARRSANGASEGTVNGVAQAPEGAARRQDGGANGTAPNGSDTATNGRAARRTNGAAPGRPHPGDPHRRHARRVDRRSVPDRRADERAPAVPWPANGGQRTGSPSTGAPAAASTSGVFPIGALAAGPGPRSTPNGQPCPSRPGGGRCGGRRVRGAARSRPASGRTALGPARSRRDGRRPRRRPRAQRRPAARPPSVCRRTAVSPLARPVAGRGPPPPAPTRARTFRRPGPTRRLRSTGPTDAAAHRRCDGRPPVRTARRSARRAGRALAGGGRPGVPGGAGRRSAPDRAFAAAVGRRAIEHGGHVAATGTDAVRPALPPPGARAHG